ncbi:MAG: glutaredoxin family protein [Aquabacterium sp.]
MTTTPQPANDLRRSWKSLALVLLVVAGGMQAWGWWQDEHTATLIKRHARPDSITLYTTETCIYCAKARDWLSAHGVPWRECNIDKDQACARTFNAHGAPGTPLVLANGQWNLGFDQAWLAEALQTPSPGTGKAL